MSSQRILVMLYPGCISFEIMLAIEILGTEFPIDVVTTNNDIHTDRSGLQIKPQLLFEEILVKNYAALIIPGGNPDVIIGQTPVQELIQAFHTSGSIVAGICAGVLVLADSGILQEQKITHNYTPKYAPQKIVELTAQFWQNTLYEDALCVTSETIITALPNGYIDFATQLGEKLGVYSTEQAKQMNRYYKGFSLDS